jgi:1-acyl-sn-glycerol-3-phosphate acyltransferase
VRPLIKWLFFALVVRPAVLLVLGLHVRHRERLPLTGPAIIAANHNSHLDALVLMSLMPRAALLRTHPVAAADYFLTNRWLAAFTVGVLGILPIERGERAPGASTVQSEPKDILEECEAALRRGAILIVFPEGTRGEPETLARMKSGVARLLARVPETTLVPVFMHGLGKTLPKGAWLPVPFACDVIAGVPLLWRGDRIAFMEQLRQAMRELQDEGRFPDWE